MTAEEFLNNRLVAAGVLVAILGFFSWLNVRSARKLSGRQCEILAHMDTRTKEMLERMRRGVR
jgi:hypothetical protein